MRPVSCKTAKQLQYLQHVLQLIFGCYSKHARDAYTIIKSQFTDLISLLEVNNDLIVLLNGLFRSIFVKPSQSVQILASRAETRRDIFVFCLIHGLKSKFNVDVAAELLEHLKPRKSFSKDLITHIHTKAIDCDGFEECILFSLLKRRCGFPITDKQKTTASGRDYLNELSQIELHSEQSTLVDNSLTLDDNDASNNLLQLEPSSSLNNIELGVCSHDRNSSSSDASDFRTVSEVDSLSSTSAGTPLVDELDHSIRHNAILSEFLTTSNSEPNSEPSISTIDKPSVSTIATCNKPEIQQESLIDRIEAEISNSVGSTNILQDCRVNLSNLQLITLKHYSAVIETIASQVANIYISEQTTFVSYQNLIDSLGIETFTTTVEQLIIDCPWMLSSRGFCEISRCDINLIKSSIAILSRLLQQLDNEILCLSLSVDKKGLKFFKVPTRQAFTEFIERLFFKRPTLSDTLSQLLQTSHKILRAATELCSILLKLTIEYKSVVDYNLNSIDFSQIYLSSPLQRDLSSVFSLLEACALCFQRGDKCFQQNIDSDAIIAQLGEAIQTYFTRFDSNVPAVNYKHLINIVPHDVDSLAQD